jgi:WS/DGAT/MGAT family acyltransferase
MWVVEGIEGNRFAIIFKAHHCMVDGIAGFDLLTRIIRPDPEATIEPPRAWFPKPAPSSARLLLDEILLRATLPFEGLRVAGRLVGEPQEVIASAQEAVAGMREVLGAGLAPTSATPLNAEIGPYRRFDWARFDMSAVKEVKNALGGTVNDVVLATAAGALGRFLRRRGVPQNDKRFRAQVPVSIRTPGEHGTEGNRLVMLLAELPVYEQDPCKRLSQVVEITQRLKQSRQRAGVAFFEEVSDRTLTSLFVYFARLATWQRSFNIVITNIPGPPIPGYLLGARMLEVYPLVPLAKNQALGIALFSYAGSLYWGLNSDWDTLPDLHDFVMDLHEEFERTNQAASNA